MDKTMVVTYKRCGCIIEDYEITANDGSVFCDEDCAIASGYNECQYCGDWIPEDDGLIADHEFFCSERCAERAGYRECQYCGDWFYYRGEGIETDDGSHFCSEECAMNADYAYCDRCGEWTRDTYPYFYGYVCESCIEWHEMRWCDGDGMYVDPDDCDGCTCHCEYAFPDFIGCGDTIPRSFYRIGDSDTQEPFIGVELEMCDGSWADAARELYYNSKWRNHYELKEDGSISYGFELASMPMTPTYHVQTGIWEFITKTARERDVRSHDGSSECSLHMHVGRDFFDDAPTAAAVIQTLFERFWTEFVSFSRRRRTYWCKLNPETYGDEPPRKESWHLEECEKFYDKRSHGDRYCALNLTRHETFEIRLWMGTLNPDTIKATVGMTYALALAGKSMPLEWVDTVTWDDFKAFAIAANQSTGAAPYLATYFEGRGL